MDDLHFTPDGSLLASSSGKLSRWDPGTSTHAKILDGVQNFDLSPDGRMLVALSEGRAFLHDLREGTLRELPVGGDRATRVCFAESEEIVVTGHASGRILIHHFKDAEPKILFAHDGLITGLAVHPKGDWIASTAEEEEPVIRLWPLARSTTMHERPLSELLTYLRSQTNLRIITDAQSPTGYRIDIAPFPGW